MVCWYRSCGGDEGGVCGVGGEGGEGGEKSLVERTNAGDVAILFSFTV
jgi:hypothetical protein